MTILSNKKKNYVIPAWCELNIEEVMNELTIEQQAVEVKPVPQA
jgi:hypothetical protein